MVTLLSDNDVVIKGITAVALSEFASEQSNLDAIQKTLGIAPFSFIERR